MGVHPTRYTFDGLEYGVVDREIEKWDFVVIRRHGSAHLRIVTDLVDEIFTVNLPIGMKHEFDVRLDEYFVVERLEEAEPYKNDAHLGDLIEDETDDFKNFLLNKNDRYGDSVLHTYRKYGQVSFDVRIEDKKNRLKYLLENNGDIEDTIKDLHGYMILNNACRKLENQ